MSAGRKSLADFASMSFRQDAQKMNQGFGTTASGNQTGSGWNTKPNESESKNNAMRQSLYQTASMEAFNLSRSQEGFFRGRNSNSTNTGEKTNKKLYTTAPSQSQAVLGQESIQTTSKTVNVKLKPLAPINKPKQSKPQEKT